MYVRSGVIDLTVLAILYQTGMIASRIKEESALANYILTMHPVLFKSASSWEVLSRHLFSQFCSTTYEAFLCVNAALEGNTEVIFQLSLLEHSNH